MLCAIFASGDDDACHLIEEDASAAMNNFFVKGIHAFNNALHEARAAAPPDRRRENYDVRRLDLPDDRRRGDERCR